VTGSIAAYRAADLTSQLTQAGVEVDVILTEQALRFITPLTFQSLSRRRVFTDHTEDGVEGQPTHIALADHCDLFVVAPATAHFLGLATHGLAPDLLSSTFLATPAPVLIAPAMNGKMWLHAAVQDNVRTLKKRGVTFIGPAAGLLACGYEGLGRLYPIEEITKNILKQLRKKV
jgi:phosphopantothenoylcysteine synthetase/decarboxylase